MEADERTQRVFALRGFVSGPHVQKLNRNSIFLFVNGRLIRDRAAAARALGGVSQPDAAGLLSIRAAVSGLRLRRGGRERASFEDGSAFPPRHASCTISCAIRFASA